MVLLCTFAGPHGFASQGDTLNNVHHNPAPSLIIILIHSNGSEIIGAFQSAVTLAQAHLLLHAPGHLHLPVRLSPTLV